MCVSGSKRLSTSEVPPSNVPTPLPCDWSPQLYLSRPKRHTAFLRRCHRPAAPALSLEEVHSDVTPSIATLSADDAPCLKRVIRQRCGWGGAQRVPRVAHYVRFGSFNMTLDGFLSVLSVARLATHTHGDGCIIVSHRFGSFNMTLDVRLPQRAQRGQVSHTHTWGWLYNCQSPLRVFQHDAGRTASSACSAWPG